MENFVQTFRVAVRFDKYGETERDSARYRKFDQILFKHKQLLVYCRRIRRLIEYY